MTDNKFSQKHNYERMKIVSRYNAISRYHDIFAKLPSVVGFHEREYRQMAVNALQLKPGDTVVDLGCGTGLNFELLEPIIGKQGKIIGVDMSSGMLAQAQKRIQTNGWKNIELEQSDVTTFKFPAQVNGILATWVLSFVPESSIVIQNGCKSLAPFGLWAITDQKMPESWPPWSAKVYSALTQQFGITSEMMSSGRWQAIRDTFSKCLVNTMWSERYFGFVYIASGERPPYQIEGG